MSISADTRTILLPRPSIAQRRFTSCGSLAFCLVISIIFSAAHGPANIPYSNVARLLLRGLNFPIGLDLPQSHFVIVNAIRLPRNLIRALVGAALTCSGATMQGVFHNPLVDPGLLGISAGSGLAAVIVITSGAAFVGAMIASILVYGLSLTRGRSNPSTLILPHWHGGEFAAWRTDHGDTVVY